MKQKLIDQLIHKAGARFGGDGINYDGFVPSKFAELIVKECCHIMNTTAKKAEESNTYMGDDVPTRVHQYTIKQHFGVEK